MEKIKNLNRYQKSILLLVSIMMLVFTIVYPTTIARKGFAYKNAILIPNQENGNTVYSGKIQGKQAKFTVSADKTVNFKYGNKTYGPYTVKEDPTAIPKNEELGEMTGVELRCGGKILFRGGVQNQGELHWLYNEDGSLADTGVSVITMTSSGIALDENGNEIDQMEPSVSTILDLMSDPELTHKGEWMAWFCGMLVCIATTISILFADKLFRWNLAFRIRNVDHAEPSDWEIADRYVTWTVLPILALILFIMGLQY